MRKLPDGGAEVAWTYEFPPAGEGLGKDDKANWRREANFRQRNIQEHPNFAKLQKKYGWDEDEKMFPKDMPDSDGGSGFSGSDAGKKNPMHGRKSFDDLGATLVHTYYVESLSSIDKDL